MVIFGAGASYDSDSARRADQVPIQPHRPPLASELFDLRFGHLAGPYRQLLGIIPRLRPGDGQTVEQKLEQLRTDADAGQLPHVVKQLMAMRYYLRDVLQFCGSQWQAEASGSTNYAVLVDLIERWRYPRDETVLLVTFNYDTLLEHALRSTGVEFPSVASFVTDSRYKVFKVHGSIDWARIAKGVPQAPQTSSPDGYVECALSLTLGSEYVTIGEVPAVMGAPIYVPAVAIPTVAKTDFEMPDEHLATLNEAMPGVNRILVVGWRGLDDHFLNLMRNVTGTPSHPGVVVEVVDRDEESARTVIDHLVVSGLKVSSARAAEGGFSPFVLRGQSALLA